MHRFDEIAAAPRVNFRVTIRHPWIVKKDLTIGTTAQTDDVVIDLDVAVRNIAATFPREITYQDVHGDLTLSNETEHDFHTRCLYQ